jgi:AI-2E family transporter
MSRTWIGRDNLGEPKPNVPHLTDIWTAHAILHGPSDRWAEPPTATLSITALISETAAQAAGSAPMRNSRSLYAALIVFIGLNILQFVIGSYIEPRVARTAVSVSPFMVLFAVFFWGMLWGVAGAFIGVPILIALATVCARHPGARPLAVLLSSNDATAVRTNR